MPPSMGMMAPVTKLALSDTSQRAALAISVGSPNLAIGTWAITWLPRAVNSSVFSSSIRKRFCAVRQKPGASAFTRIRVE